MEKLGKRAQNAKSELEDMGLRWIKGTYNNLESLLEVECTRYKHNTKVSLKEARKKGGCPTCSLQKEIRERETTEDLATDIKHLGEKKGYRILALDQATRETGFSIYDGVELIHHGVFKANTGEDMSYRINAVNKWVTEVISLASIDAVALEGVQYQGNPKTLIDLAKLLGSLEQTAYSLTGAMPLIVLAAQWKSTCKIGGRARAEQKRNAQIFVKRKFGIEASSDAADAICLGYHAVHKAKANNKVKSYASDKIAFKVE